MTATCVCVPCADCLSRVVDAFEDQGESSLLAGGRVNTLVRLFITPPSVAEWTSRSLPAAGSLAPLGWQSWYHHFPGCRICTWSAWGWSRCPYLTQTHSLCSPVWKDRQSISTVQRWVKSTSESKSPTMFLFYPFIKPADCNYTTPQPGRLTGWQKNLQFTVNKWYVLTKNFFRSL